MKQKAVILLSGGQDSTTCLYWALEQDFEVYAVGFNYGQSHIEELNRAQLICDRLNVPFRIFDLTGLIAKSSLTEHTDHNERSYVNDNLDAAFTAGRNIVFTSIAAGYACEIGATNIVAGLNQMGTSGYPDCRRDTTDAMQETLSLGYGAGPFTIHTPIMFMNKDEVWKLGKELNCLDVIINDTITDYDANQEKHPWGTGSLNNSATRLRAKGYESAKIKGWI